MYLAEKEAQPVADGIILEYWGFCEDGILSDPNFSRLSERTEALHREQTCALWILEKLTTWLLGWEYCVTLGLWDPQPISANFQIAFPNPGSGGPIHWLVYCVAFEPGIWADQVCQPDYFLPLTLTFYVDRPLNRKPWETSCAFFKVLWRACINRHRERERELE